MTSGRDAQHAREPSTKPLAIYCCFGAFVTTTVPSDAVVTRIGRVLVGAAGGSTTRVRPVCGDFTGSGVDPPGRTVRAGIAVCADIPPAGRTACTRLAEAGAIIVFVAPLAVAAPAGSGRSIVIPAETVVPADSLPLFVVLPGTIVGIAVTLLEADGATPGPATLADVGDGVTPLMVAAVDA
jgi:hypothetical protein